MAPAVGEHRVQNKMLNMSARTMRNLRQGTLLNSGAYSKSYTIELDQGRTKVRHGSLDTKSTFLNNSIRLAPIALDYVCLYLLPYTAVFCCPCFTIERMYSSTERSIILFARRLCYGCSTVLLRSRSITLLLYPYE